MAVRYIATLKANRAYNDLVGIDYFDELNPPVEPEEVDPYTSTRAFTRIDSAQVFGIAPPPRSNPVMLAARRSPANGYVIEGNAAALHHTFVFDLLIDSDHLDKWMPQLQTDPGNHSPADVYIGAGDHLPASPPGRSPGITIPVGEWTRVIIAVDLENSPPSLTTYVNGTLQDTYGIDPARWGASGGGIGIGGAALLDAGDRMPVMILVDPCASEDALYLSELLWTHEPLTGVDAASCGDSDTRSLLDADRLVDPPELHILPGDAESDLRVRRSIGRKTAKWIA